MLDEISNKVLVIELIRISELIFKLINSVDYVIDVGMHELSTTI